VNRWYVASAFGEHARAELVAAKLREQGHEVVSTWHQPGLLKQWVDPVTRQGKASAWDVCKSEIREATHLVFLAALGNPRAAYVEVGYAIALGEESCDRGEIYWVSPDVTSTPVSAGDQAVRWVCSAQEFLKITAEWIGWTK